MSYKDRVQEESNNLEERFAKLGTFIEGNGAKLVPETYLELLVEQAEHMGKYLLILKKRIDIHRTEENK